MNVKSRRLYPSRRGLATGSLVILVIIIISIALLAGYGSYRYIPQVHSVVHSVIHPSATTQQSFSTPSIQTIHSTTIVITQPIIVSTIGGTTEFFATTSTSQYFVSTTLSNSETTTSVSSQVSSVTSTQSQSLQNSSLLFVQNWPPSVYLSSGQAYLNASYTNTFNANMSVYEHTVLTSTSGVIPVGGPLFTVPAGGNMTLTLQLGVNLTPGDYLVTFYVVNNSTGQQVSQSESIHFKV